MLLQKSLPNRYLLSLSMSSINTPLSNVCFRNSVKIFQYYFTVFFLNAEFFFSSDIDGYCLKTIRSFYGRPLYGRIRGEAVLTKRLF